MAAEQLILQNRLRGYMMKETIKKILSDIRPEFNFDESEDFIEDGFLDSFDIVSLITMLEENFKITVDGLDIVPENFTNYEAITKLIEKSGERS